jgi:hypothetical protein
MKSYIRLVTTTCLFTLAIVAGAYSQAGNFQWDYEAYPPLRFEIEHLDAEISISETGSIEGDLLYTIRFRDQGVDSLILDAPGMEIARLSVKDESGNYYIDGDQLVIILEQEFEMGDRADLRIQYRTRPGFGLFQTARGTFFTSSLPRSTSHWLPVADHPRVAFTTELIFSYPSGKRLISNGRSSSSEVASVDRETTTYSANRPVSPSEINFVMGGLSLKASTLEDRSQLSAEQRAHFERRSNPQIYIHSETDHIDADRLMEKAASSYNELYHHFGIGFPYRDLHIVVLEDDFWETKAFSAGMIYLFLNRDDLDKQLATGMTGQWIGSHLRAERWSESGAVSAWMASTLNSLFDYELETGQIDGHFGVFNQASIDRWRYFLAETPEGERLESHLQLVRNDVIKERTDVLSWSDLSRAIYRESGYPYFGTLELPHVEADQEEVYDYIVNMDWNESENRVTLTFEAIDGYIDELVSAVVREYSFLDEKDHEIAFTGQNDQVVINVSANVENLTLNLVDRDDIHLTVRKPFSFWVYQLRESDDAGQRKEAASALATFSDNPDLQLALRDHLNSEENSEVYAEMLRSLSAITMGASGTEQQFFDHLSDSYDPEVRVAAVEALAYFRDDDRVISQLRSVVNRTGNEKIKETGIRSLYEVTDIDRFTTIAEDLITRESNLKQVPLILQLLAAGGNEEEAVHFSSTFLAEGFPYEVRSKVLDLVLQHDQSESGWQNRLPGLLSDIDPRIRYQSLPAIERVDSAQREDLLEQRAAAEYDIRVRNALEQYR